jgi:MFS family permease
VADPVTAQPEELTVVAAPAERSLGLLRRRNFRRTYAAIVVSEIGDAFHYVALMWIALVTGGPLGVLAVRLADSVPALVFGFHGGLLADRLDRRRTMIVADVVRAAILVPLTVAGLAHALSLWALVVAAFGLESATMYFAPAYGALLPTLVDRRNVQTANGLVQATTSAVQVGGWAAAAAVLAVAPLAAFFALNAASFVVSALLLARVHAPAGELHARRPRIREGFAALRPRPALAIAVAAVGVGVTISSGTWIVGVPQLVRTTLGRGAASFSLVAAAYAVGAVVGGIVLARLALRRKALTSVCAWALYAPAYALFATAHSLPVTLVAGAGCGFAQSSALVLVNAAAQEAVPDRVLGRVMGLLSLVHRGAHATGLLIVSPLFALFAAEHVFAGAAIALPSVTVAGLAALALIRRRAI